MFSLNLRLQIMSLLDLRRRVKLMLESETKWRL